MATHPSSWRLYSLCIRAVILLITLLLFVGIASSGHTDNNRRDVAGIDSTTGTTGTTSTQAAQTVGSKPYLVIEAVRPISAISDSGSNAPIQVKLGEMVTVPSKRVGTGVTGLNGNSFAVSFHAPPPTGTPTKVAIFITGTPATAIKSNSARQTSLSGQTATIAAASDNDYGTPRPGGPISQSTSPPIKPPASKTGRLNPNSTPTIYVTNVDGRFYWGASTFFNVGTQTPPAFTQHFPLVNFNPPAGYACAGATVTYDTRPLTDVDESNPCAFIIAQATAPAPTPTLLQAGKPPLAGYQAVFLTNLYVSDAADITFFVHSDDGFVWGIGPKIGDPSAQPTRVSGVFTPGPPPSPTPYPTTTFGNYMVVAQLNDGTPTSGMNSVTVRFPAAGFYPIEIDNAENALGFLFITLETSPNTPVLNGPSPTATPVCATTPYWCQKSSPNIAPDSNELYSVAAITNDNIWAVGDHQLNPTPADSLVEHWDGTTWSIVTVTPVGALHAITKVQTEVPTPELWAVGDGGVLHLSNGSWTANTAITGMKGVAAQGPKDVYAVGTAIMHYTGPVSGWSGATPIPAGSTLNGAAVLLARTPVGNLTPTNTPIRVVWAVGANSSVPLTMQQVGTTGAWSTVEPAATPTGSTISWLNSVDSFTANNVWAVGAYYVAGQNKTYSLTEHYDGSSWTVITSPNPGNFYNELKGVFYNYEGDLWAVGSYSPDSYSADLHPLILHWTDTEWQQVDAALVGADSELLGLGTSTGAPNYSTSNVGDGNPVYANSVWAVGRYQNSNGGSYNTLIESIIAPTATIYATPQSRSLYEFNADSAIHKKQGCEAAERHESGVIVLDYGRPVDAYACPGPLPCVNLYGALPVQVFVQQRPTAIPISVAAGVDFEPDFSNYDDTPTPGQTLTPNSPRAWATAYSAAGVSVYYDFGSTDGYPAPGPSDPTPPVPPLSCCSAWRVDQLYDISWSIPQALPLPEIYLSQTSRYWYAVKRWAAEHNKGMVFSGEMTQCGSGDCHTFDTALNWTQAWQILWLELNADERTGFQQNLNYSTDIWP